MKKKNTRITGSEREVLELLWEENQPLTSAEIVKISEHKTWKPSYIHLMINSLLKKNVIQVAGFKQTTKNYARTFTPTMTREEFSIRMLREENQLNASSLSLLFGALLEEDVDMDVIDELSDMLQKKKEELEAADSGISQNS
ncbi:MAG: BlaI/MecI/CopY family transcriptional regulator [Eubacterium sp.]|nr:BlaI/MecI/CopY family transcriptional regulator [Eubacterium sp.]